VPTLLGFGDGCLPGVMDWKLAAILSADVVGRGAGFKDRHAVGTAQSQEQDCPRRTIVIDQNPFYVYEVNVVLASR
jgi:hypothetical protein